MPVATYVYQFDSNTCTYMTIKVASLLVVFPLVNIPVENKQVRSRSWLPHNTQKLKDWAVTVSENLSVIDPLCKNLELLAEGKKHLVLLKPLSLLCFTILFPIPVCRFHYTYWHNILLITAEFYASGRFYSNFGCSIEPSQHQCKVQGRKTECTITDIKKEFRPGIVHIIVGVNAMSSGM